MSDVKVRPERSEDTEAIAAVVAAAFGSPAEARLVEAIRASENFVEGLSLVAEARDEIVGHVMVSYVGLRTPEGMQRIASLSPLAVASALQGQGIGSALVDAVTGAADERGEPLVVLEGSPDYYGRLGFEYSVPYGITMDLPSWAPPEAAQIAERERSMGRSIQPWVRRLAWAHALTRMTIGTALLVAPSVAARPWLGTGASTGGGRVALQAFAVRDAALGLGMARSLARNEPVRHWFRLGLAFELIDGGATVRYREELPDGWVPDGFALLGLAGLVGGAVVAVLLDE